MHGHMNVKYITLQISECREAEVVIFAFIFEYSE
jgi:hypothetical protein